MATAAMLLSAWRGKKTARTALATLWELLWRHGLEEVSAAFTPADVARLGTHLQERPDALAADAVVLAIGVYARAVQRLDLTPAAHPVLAHLVGDDLLGEEIRAAAVWAVGFLHLDLAREELEAYQEAAGALGQAVREALARLAAAASGPGTP